MEIVLIIIVICFILWVVGKLIEKWNGYRHSVKLAGNCTICGRRFKMKYFDWEINGKPHRLCPKCNHQQEWETSKEKFRDYSDDDDKWH
jgi:DNA-directed RNA polymerase subunit RPC12/RpoP